MEENRQIMRALATAMNRIDQMYCDDVTRIGVKASELWLLYALDDGAPHSQKQICQEWGLPKTTLNTTLKQAEAKGYLTLGRCLRDSFAKQMEEKENDDNP